jgi:hypothetical protein
LQSGRSRPVKPLILTHISVTRKKHQQNQWKCVVVPAHFSREAIIKTREDARAIKADIERLERKLRFASPEMQLRLKLDPTPGWQPPLLIELAKARAECDRADAAAPQTDKTKEWCARTAFRIINKFSEKGPTGTDEGPYRLIAMYLFEAVTKKAGHDLKRDCFDHLRMMREALAAVAKAQFTD